MARTRTRLALSAGALLGIGALVTAAAFNDFANLNLGNGTSGSGIGAGTFNIQVVGTDPVTHAPAAGTWQEADTVQGVDIAVAGADTITPGDTISVALPYRNVSDTLGADIRVWLNQVPGTSSTPAYLSALRFTVKDSTGAPLVSNLSFDDFSSLADSAQLSGGNLAAGDADSLTLAITLLDYDADSDPLTTNASLNGGVARVQLHFDAESV